MTLDKNIVYIGVGSNIDPQKNITAALKLLIQKVKVLKISSMYKSPPLFNKNNNYFLNGIWKIETELPPYDLKYDLLKKIEVKLLRKRTNDKNTPRTIDLDILLYADLVIKKEGLIIPDPDIIERPFIYIPLFDLDPDLTIPGENTSIKAICEKNVKHELQRQDEFTKELGNIINYITYY